MLNGSEVATRGEAVVTRQPVFRSDLALVMASRSPTISVVIPTLNEAKNLPLVLPRLPEIVTEVILVDGLSTDGTVDVALQLCPDIRIITESRRGKGLALRRGFEAATGDIIVMLDADGSADPEEIPFFVGALLSGVDFAKGSRFLQGGGTSDMVWYRRLGNRLFVALVRVLFGGQYSDLCYGYNAFWRRVLPLLDLNAEGFEIETLMNVRALHAGLHIAEVPSFEKRRVTGESNLRTFPDGWRVLRTIFAEWRRRPTLRAVKQCEAVFNGQFIRNMRMLFHEAIQLSYGCKRLTDEAYSRALEALKAAYEELLYMEVSSSHEVELQERYRRYFSPERIWQFLELDRPS